MSEPLKKQSSLSLTLCWCKILLWALRRLVPGTIGASMVPGLPLAGLFLWCWVQFHTPFSPLPHLGYIALHTTLKSWRRSDTGNMTLSFPPSSVSFVLTSLLYQYCNFLSGLLHSYKGISYRMIFLIDVSVKGWILETPVLPSCWRYSLKLL